MSIELWSINLPRYSSTQIICINGDYQYLLPCSPFNPITTSCKQWIQVFCLLNFGCAFMSLMTCSCCYLFFRFWHYWLFPTMEDMNSVFFPTEHLPPSKPHFTPLLSFQRCVTLLVRWIFSVYTNMVMEIFTAELSSIMISIIFPSSHNFLFSLELLVFLCLFNLPCFLRTYHWFIPKILSQLSKISLNSANVSGISAIYSSGKHVSGGCCHLDWLLQGGTQLWFWNLPSPYLWDSHHLPCELLNQLLNCSLSIAVEKSKAFWLLIPKRWLIFHFIFWNFVMMSLGAGFALIPLGL